MTPPLQATFPSLASLLDVADLRRGFPTNSQDVLCRAIGKDVEPATRPRDVIRGDDLLSLPPERAPASGARPPMSSCPTVQDGERLSALFEPKSFTPPEPRNLEEAGLSEALVETLICKQLAALGNATGRDLSDHLCLPYGVLEPRFQKLRSRQLLGGSRRYCG